ncbi:phenolic acid decarboxylase [Nocardia nova]|jgi:phenolic acid decarboxylase|uniref:phenolic acid decarboxylase n=1 Tax=Nocardia nova TaxID=37330 RepID=UPI001893CB2E|nr:phenolic acid decarboxylase [Nocardia nova]MBF6148602.1 phenolic acid decarboxylase [Nocardia nova]MDN2500008.1 phenolic acid decarboxylase [Nocardia nova]
MTDLGGLLGHRFVYTYANGWRYEMYVKNARTIDYRIHSGMVGGRWVKDQNVDIVRLTEGHFKVSWTEPTGTSVAVDILPGLRRLHGVIFFPRWVEENPQRTVLFQNDHLEQMAGYREAGPTYPIHVVSEFATITWAELIGENDETVIACAPSELPAGFADRTN